MTPYFSITTQARPPSILHRAVGGPFKHANLIFYFPDSNDLVSSLGVKTKLLHDLALAY